MLKHPDKEEDRMVIKVAPDEFEYYKENGWPLCFMGCIIEVVYPDEVKEDA